MVRYQEWRYPPLNYPTKYDIITKSAISYLLIRLGSLSIYSQPISLGTSPQLYHTLPVERWGHLKVPLRSYQMRVSGGEAGKERGVRTS